MLQNVMSSIKKKKSKIMPNSLFHVLRKKVKTRSLFLYCQIVHWREALRWHFCWKGGCKWRPQFVLFSLSNQLTEVTNFGKDWLKVPVLTKLAWPFNFTEWRPVDYLCLDGFAKSFCPTLNKLVTQPTFTSNIFPISVSSGSQANISQLISKPGDRIL